MKNEYSDAQVAAFLRKSYIAVDGLWFVKTEEKRGFDEAMELDEAVWAVMPKIQARRARAILGITGNSLEDLARAFKLKFASEGFDFDSEHSEKEVKLIVRSCPWYEIMKSSNRLHVSESVTNRICRMEFSGWIKEFDPTIRFEMHKTLCRPQDKCETCEIAFMKD